MTNELSLSVVSDSLTEAEKDPRGSRAYSIEGYFEGMRSSIEES